MPKYEIKETCNEIRVYTYIVEADSEDAARKIYDNGECRVVDSKFKDCLYTEIDIEELENEGD